MQKLKCYVLIVSQYFPEYHSKKGQPTYFVDKIKDNRKIHTIRGNYELWKKRIDEVNAGEAYISVRTWSGKPYKSSQNKDVFTFHKGEIGIQELKNPKNFVFAPVEGNPINWGEIAENDGLSFDDFCEWFKVREDKPMAIIHFTDFRY